MNSAFSLRRCFFRESWLYKKIKKKMHNLTYNEYMQRTRRIALIHDRFPNLQYFIMKLSNAANYEIIT